jgi:L-threonylcarbamoyladenylate synthase
MLLKHYALKAPLYLVRSNSDEKLAAFFNEVSRDSENAVICFDGFAPESFNVYFMGGRNDEIEHARRLFDLLRVADTNGAKRIYAPMPSREGMGLALQNRMLRAAAFRIKDL